MSRKIRLLFCRKVVYMAFIIPHKSDLIVDGQIIRQQLIENFKAIEQEESQLRNDLNDETDARKSADSDERNARINADNRLQSQIDAIIQRLDKNEKNIADLQTRMKTAEEQIKQLNETVYGMPSALLNEASSVDDDENDNQPLQEINTERNGILDAQ